MRDFNYTNIHWNLVTRKGKSEEVCVICALCVIQVQVCVLCVVQVQVCTVCDTGTGVCAVCGSGTGVHCV